MGSRIAARLHHGLDHRLQRQISVIVAPGVVPDLLADAPALPGQPGVDPELLPALGRELEVEEAPRLDLHAVAAVAPVFHAHDAAFERVDALGLEHDLEHGHELRRLGRILAVQRAVPTRHGLDVLGRVIGAPGVAVGLVELGVAHPGVVDHAMVQIELVEVAVHPDALLEELLMVLRAGQRRQDEEFEDVERQFLLDDLDVTQHRFARVAREAVDVARPARGAAGVPGLQHLAVFGDLVLALLGRHQVVGIDVL